MNDIRYSVAQVPGMDQLVKLYDSVGWTNYTKDPERLIRAVAGSRAVVTAFSGNRLVGLARVVGDGASIAYMQDVLVDPEFQRQGIGRELVKRVFKQHDVRQRVLITDDDPVQHAFYKSLGFTDTRDLDTPIRTFLTISRPE